MAILEQCRECRAKGNRGARIWRPPLMTPLYARVAGPDNKRTWVNYGWVCEHGHVSLAKRYDDPRVFIHATDEATSRWDHLNGEPVEGSAWVKLAAEEKAERERREAERSATRAATT